MNLLDRLLKKDSPAPALPSIAFVDFEYWYYSYKNLFAMTPNIRAWKEGLPYEPVDIMVFAEFSSNNGIAEQVTELRTVTNTIIETRQQTGFRKKDMTDFIMLDYIYRTAATRPEIGTYIIFTGDGHFQSVVKYLTGLGKEVIIYGIKESISTALRAVATKVIEIPDNEALYDRYAMLIINNLAHAQTRNSIIPTFNGTISAIVRQNDNISEEMLRLTLQDMIDAGLINRKMRSIDFNRKVKVLSPDWEKLHDAGLWDYGR